MARIPSGSPRSVPDPYSAAYDEMIAQHLRDQQARQALAASPTTDPPPSQLSGSPSIGHSDPNNHIPILDDVRDAVADFQEGAPIGHPGFAESLIPVEGSGREALADFQERNYLGAGFNGVLALSDLVPAKAVGEGLLKGGVKVAGPMVWRMKPWLEDAERGVESASTWMRKERVFGMSHLKPGQAGHHWAIPQNGWGKVWPDWLKNQPWNIKPMPDARIHGLIHDSYKGEPQFNALERYWHGTPDWWKALNLSYAGRGLDYLGNGLNQVIGQFGPGPQANQRAYQGISTDGRGRPQPSAGGVKQ